MTQPYTHWNVLPHGKLSAIDEGILTVVGQIRMPLMNLPRRMTVVRLNDSRLVVWSAIALDEQEMATFEAFGRPAFLIVPNDHHRLDARAWKDRYPQMQVVAPGGSRAKVEAVVPVDTTAPDFGDPRVERGSLQFARLQRSHPLVRRAQAALQCDRFHAALFARRCLYRRQGAVLLVTEVFLPAIADIGLLLPGRPE